MLFFFVGFKNRVNLVLFFSLNHGCDLAHRRSVYAVLDQCNPMILLYGVLHEPYVPVRVTCGAVIAHRYTYEPPRCRTPQYLQDLYSPVSIYVERPWCDTAGFQEQIEFAFLLA